MTTRLDRPVNVAYHAGPWRSDMRQRRALDERGQPTGMLTFFGGCLWWSSVEARIRVAMTRADGAWGCSSAWDRKEAYDDDDACE